MGRKKGREKGRKGEGKKGREKGREKGKGKWRENGREEKEGRRKVKGREWFLFFLREREIKKWGKAWFSSLPTWSMPSLYYSELKSLLKFRKEPLKMYQFCLELKKNPCKGEIPLQSSPSFAPVLPRMLGKKIKLKKFGRGIISSWSQLYTPLVCIVRF